MQSTKPSELDLVRTLVDTLDVKFTGNQHATTVYLVKFHRASQLAEVVGRWMEGSDLAQRFRLVPHDGSNTILIRSQSRRNAEVLNLLMRLDRVEIAPVPTPEPGTGELVVRTYRLEHASAPDVAAALRREVAGQGIAVSAHAPSRSVLLRLPRAAWTDVQKRLEQLDR